VRVAVVEGRDHVVVLTARLTAGHSHALRAGVAGRSAGGRVFDPRGQDSVVLGVVVLAMVVLVWALVARRLATLSITTAIAVVIAGMVLTAGSHPVIRINLDTTIVERGVEVVLAILLFVDATEVPSGILGRERGVLMRLLAIALPFSLILAWLVGLALFSERDAWLLAVLAIIVVPVDLAPAVAIVRDRRVPEPRAQAYGLAEDDVYIPGTTCSQWSGSDLRFLRRVVRWANDPREVSLGRVWF
jgi:hypothetical protein